MALMIALYNQLKARGYTVSIATFYYTFIKEKYPDLPIIRELIDYRFLKKRKFLKKIFFTINFIFNKSYYNHDVFIASPGGYVNSYYGIKDCLLPLVQAKRLLKKTAIYSQSVGPLNERDKARLTKFSNDIDVILVRDDYSKNCISSFPCHSHVFQTKDAAFLLPPRKSTAPASSKIVAVSVREWQYDNRNMKGFMDMIREFCEILLVRGYSIEFISTCQGIKNYRDDSTVAYAIRDALVKATPDFSQHVSVNSTYHTYYELSELLNTRYACVVGTRLHMCLLSLINGVPSFNISYEVKGRECYKYLGLENYSVDFNEPLVEALKKFNDFIENHRNIQVTLPDKLLSVHNESKIMLDLFLQKMGI